MINFVTTLINQIFYAKQEASLASLNYLISQVIMFILLIIISNFSNSDILLLSFIFGLSTLISNLIFSLIFLLKNKNIKINSKFIDMSKTKDVISLGYKFFIIQLGCLIIYSTDNLIITQLLGVEQVTIYNTVYKLFSLITTGFTLFITPLWVGFTDAYIKKDVSWIKKTYKYLFILEIGVVIVTVILVILGDFIMNLWVGSSLKAPFILFVCMGLYEIILTWYNLFVYFLNGVSKVTRQMVCVIIGAIVNIPISIILAKYFNIGVAGIILGTVVSLLPLAICSPIEVYAIIKSIDKDK